MTITKELISSLLREQKELCQTFKSPLYVKLLDYAAADVERGGACWLALKENTADPKNPALALSFLGAVHYLVLRGDAVELSRFYPSVGGDSNLPDLCETFSSVVENHLDEIKQLIHRPVQTNEVRRSAALLGGYLFIAQLSQLPLRILELGASAGLNLCWDHYYYKSGDLSWGDPQSSVQFIEPFIEGRPPLDVSVQVIERRGCDLNPLSPFSIEDQLTLKSYIWPDQIDRIAMLNNALEIARRVNPSVEKADAISWLRKELESPKVGCTTVIANSIFLPYLKESDRSTLESVIANTGDKATERSLIAWLQMEPGAEMADVRVKLWPGGSEYLLARTGFQGQNIRWLRN